MQIFILLCFVCRSHDFRPSYGRLHELRAILPNVVPFLACSATVTPKMRKECVEKLDMCDCEFVSHSPDRPNIIYKVQRQTTIEEDLLFVIDSLKTHLNKAPRTIVYTRSLDSCANLFATFQEIMGKQQYYPQGSPEISDNRIFGMFHASTTQHNKEVILKSLSNQDGIVRVVFATIALGMGVDMRDVSVVIHYGAPRSIDDYFQESGRGGRSGEKCVSTIYWKPAEAPLYKQPIDHYQSELVKVRKYLDNTKTCRRKLLLDYFDQVPSETKLTLCCDICNTDV